MKAYWNRLSRSDKIAQSINAFVCTYAILSFVGLPGLDVVLMVWFPFGIYNGVQMVRRTNRDLMHTKRMLDLGPQGSMSDLPGETQEEIQITWARRVLREREGS